MTKSALDSSFMSHKALIKNMAKQVQRGRKWYAIHTYSGYEENVERNLKQRIESLDMEDKIFSVLIPKEKKIKIKSGKRKIVEEKVYPGYVLVEMLVTDDSWYVVRNTPNVTGFIGSGTVPTPLSDKEIKDLQKRMGYNQDHIGSTDVDWEQRGIFGEVIE